MAGTLPRSLAQAVADHSLSRRALLALATGAASISLSGALASCRPQRGEQRPASTADWPAELTWIAWSAGNPWLAPTYEQVAAAFSERYPNLTLRVLPADGPFLEKLKTMVAAGTPPDLADTHQTQVRDLGASGVVIDLSNFLKRDPFPKDYVGWGPYTWQGKQYGIPWAIQSTALFYNRSLFDAAGIAYPTEHWTWADFLSAALRLTRPGADDANTIWGAGDQGGVNYQWIHAILVSFGGGVLKQDYSECTLSEPASIEGLEFRVSWGTKLRVAPAQPGGISGQFINVRVAMATSGSWFVANVKQNVQSQLAAAGMSWDVAPVPRGRSRRAGLAHELGLGIPAGVRHAEASWAALRYLTSPAALTPFARIGRIIPPQRSLWKEALPPDGVPPSFKQAFLDVWDEIQLEVPFVPRWSEALAIWREELDPVWKGERPVRDGAAAVKVRMDAHLRQLRAEGLL